MKKVKTNAMRQLDQAKINYETFDFLPLADTEELTYEEIGRRVGKPWQIIFKTILTKGHSGSYYVLVIPGKANLDFKKAAKIVGEKSLELAPLEDLESLTGYVRGGCSPVGMRKHYPTFLDEAAKDFDAILVSAGKRGHQILIQPEDLMVITKAGWADLTALEQSIF